MPGGRPPGARNKPRNTLLARLKKDFDLDPIERLAETCMKTIPLTTNDGEPIRDQEGNIIQIPYLKGNELVTALGKLADKCYPTLKAQDINLSGDIRPVVTVDLMGVQEETKAPPKRKAAPKKKAAPRKKAASK
jgi:hypothetical protein